jgi:intracellular sulfur oxidation DsrE/DsrF family protein
METVFHLAAGDPDEWRHAFDSVENLLADEHTQADAVLVVTGNAAYAVVESSPVADAVRELLTEGVEICACSTALGNRGIDPETLVAGVDIVESGVGELTRRQGSGAAYVNVP